MRAGVPLHGRNLLPGDDVLAGYRDTVFEHIDRVTALGHRVMAAIVHSLGLPSDHATRWDGASVHAFDGRYGDCVLAKVGKVFPDLRARVL